MITGLIEGIFSYLRALGVMGRYGLMRYLLLSGVAGLIIGALVFYLIYISYDDIGALASQMWPWEKGQNVIDYIADGLSVLIMILLFFFIYKYIIFIVLAPLMSIISQRVERAVTGEVHGSGMNLVREFIRGIRIALRNIIREIGLTLLLLILSLIFPYFAWLTGALIFLVQSYYAGFGNMDYTLERYYDTSGSVDFVKRERGFAIGNGMIFLLLLPVPVLGMFLAPFFGAVSATIGTIPRLNKA